MSLSAGAHLGPYEVLSPLGAGGIGGVMRRIRDSVISPLAKRERSKS
jgi:hypothetical protein